MEKIVCFLILAVESKRSPKKMALCDHAACVTATYDGTWCKWRCEGEREDERMLPNLSIKPQSFEPFILAFSGNQKEKKMGIPREHFSVSLYVNIGTFHVYKYLAFCSVVLVYFHEGYLVCYASNFSPCLWLSLLEMLLLFEPSCRSVFWLVGWLVCRVIIF